MAKNATSNAFIAAKKKREESSMFGIQKPAYESKIDNSFEEQHHHLLSCLEHATVCIIFNIDIIFVLLKCVEFDKGSRIHRDRFDTERVQLEAYVTQTQALGG